MKVLSFKTVKQGVLTDTANRTLYGIMLNLAQNQKSVLQMNAEQVTAIKNIAEGNTETAKYKAQSLIELSTEEVFDRNIEVWKGVAQNRIVKNIITSNDFFILSPNPADLSVTVTLENDIETNETLVQILDLQGRLIKAPTQSFDGNKSIILNIGDLNNGIYFINVSNKTKTATQKLVVNH